MSSSDDEPPAPTRRRSSRQLDDDDGSYRLRKRATNLAPITHTKPSKNAPAVTEEELERLGHARDARLFAVLAGPNQYPCVRAALECRGWTEVPESTRHVHLLWSLKTDEVDALLESGAVRPAMALNHFRRNYELITKHGLARNLRATDDDVDIDGVMPRSYFLRDVGQLREFLADYVVTAARSALHAALADGGGGEPDAPRLRVAYAVARRFLVRLAAAAADAPADDAEAPRRARWLQRSAALRAPEPPLLQTQARVVAASSLHSGTHV